MKITIKTNSKKIKKNFIDNKLLLLFLNKKIKIDDIKMKSRSTKIMKFLNNNKFSIYNGYTYKSLDISSKTIGLKFGELFPTRKMPKHKN
mgnify:CR=1 FL=1